MAKNTSGSAIAEEYHLVIKQAMSASISFLGFHLTLADTTWLLIRFSGTEPMLHI